MNLFSFGFSPCPNDTFIFDALIHNKIKHEYEFLVDIEDVETLNQMAMSSKLDISKVSTHAFFHVMDQYTLLPSGGAIGTSGPLVIGNQDEMPNSGIVGLPGKLTTASLLFQMAFQGDYQYIYMPFDQIIPAILERKIDLGVIIHESRFTYQNVGLNCLTDLGLWWESQGNELLPLGVIVMKHQFSKELRKKIGQLITASLQYAQTNLEIQQTKAQVKTQESFVLAHAKELDKEVLEQHIKLYVNQYTNNMQKTGLNSIQNMYNLACKFGIFEDNTKKITW